MDQEKSRSGSLSARWFALATVLVLTTVGCAASPAEEDMDRIREALEGLGQPYIEVSVTSQANSGFGRHVSILVTTADETVTTEQVRQILQTIYGSTPESYPVGMQLRMWTEARLNPEGGQGDGVDLNPMLEDLGLIPPGGRASYFHFYREDLEPILDE